MADRVISSTGLYTGYSAAVSVDAANDFLLIQQGGVYKKISRNVILGVTGTPADLTTVQTVQNKVVDNTNTVTLKDTLFTLQDDGDTTKQAKFQLSGITTATTRTYTLPNASSTLMDLASAQAVSGIKIFTAPVISGGSIDNTTITVDAISEHTAANGVTIASLNIKNGKLNTNNSVVTANITDTAVTPAKLQTGTGSGWAWAAYTPTTTNVTLGNGTLVGAYVQTGKTVNFRIKLTFGTTTSFGGAINFGLPVTANSVYTSSNPYILGAMWLDDSGVANYQGFVSALSTTTINPGVWNVAGTYPTVVVSVNATVPFAWGTGDSISIQGVYEAA